MRTERTGKHPLLNRPILAMLVLDLLSLILINVCALLTLGREAGPVTRALWELENSVIPPVLIVLMVKRRLGRDYMPGFRLENTLTGLRLSWLFFVSTAATLLINLLMGGVPRPEFTGIAVALMGAASAGIGEEVMTRGLFCNLMMRKWGHTNRGIWAAVIVSSLFFGLSHLMNVAVTRRLTAQILWQVLYAGALGFLFAAIYVRTRNLWSVIIAHTTLDFVSLLVGGRSGGDTVEAINAMLSAQVSTADAVYYVILITLAVAVGIYLLRPVRMTEIRMMWYRRENDGEDQLPPRGTAVVSDWKRGFLILCRDRRLA